MCPYFDTDKIKVPIKDISPIEDKISKELLDFMHKRYQAGYEAGYIAGYKEGHKNGFEEGHSAGYDEGQDEAPLRWNY